LDLTETPREISFCKLTIQAREPLLIPDASRDPRFANNPLVTGPPHIGSYLGVPLTTPDGYNVGSLCAIDTKPRNYSVEQIGLLEGFAALVMNVLELRRIARVDFLTGTITRRAFCLEMEKAISRFKRRGRTSALLTFDIDHFKRVNDTYGHPAGDLVLRSIAARLERLVRVTDLVGRMGGEEFGILLPDADFEAATKSAERFRRVIEDLVIEHEPPLRVTASFGIAVLDAQIRSAEEWLAAADTALYEAKRGGRNRWCVAP
jgi:diguanylate cyclase (GGDEF)-like protein